MSSRTCDSCLGSGEKPGIGHMPGYKCKKCSGSGKINNFLGIELPTPAAVIGAVGDSDTPTLAELTARLDAAKQELEQLKAQKTDDEKIVDVPRRGRPPKK